MSLNATEYMVLSDPGLHAEAKALYVMCFRRFMNYQDGIVFLSEARMIAELEYRPDPRSKEKPTSPSRQRIRTIIAHLEKSGLITKVNKGNITAGLAPSWRCELATNDVKKSFICPIPQQPDSNQGQQPAQQPSETHINKGLATQQQPAQQPRENTPLQPISDTTAIDNLYRGEVEQNLTNPKKAPTPRFTPPTEQQVLELMATYRNDKKPEFKIPTPDDAEAFINHYTANGWMVGRVKMKSWEATAKGWMNRNNKRDQQHAKHNGTTKQNNSNNGANDLFSDPTENVYQLSQRLQR